MDDYTPRIDRVREHIRSHLNDDLSLEALARVACFSPWHFHRVFTAFTGETPDDCVRRLRLEHAAGLLSHLGDLSVSRISELCGFSTLSLFTRNFKKHFGITPKEWKDHKNRITWSKNRQDPTAPSPYPVLGSGRFTFEVVRRETVTIAYKLHSLGYHRGVAEVFGHLGRWALAQGFLREDTRRFGIPLDNPLVTPADRCRFLAGIEVPRVPDRDEPGLWFMELPGGLHVHSRFRLHENRFPDFYRERSRWLAENGWRNADQESNSHGFIEYLAGPGGRSKSEAGIYLPVVPRP